MPIFARKKDYEAAPQGLHDAVCVDVVDLGVVPSEKWGPQVKVKVVWQLAETDKRGRRFLVNKRYTPSLGKKANLRKDLESWRGKPFTPQELKQFDIEKLLGANAQLSLSHNVGDDGSVWVNVTAVVPSSKMAQKLFAEDYEREIHRAGYVPPTQPEPEVEEPEYDAPPDEEDSVPF
jgi:hypothetical protein